jgi:hypothetical protein
METPPPFIVRRAINERAMDDEFEKRYYQPSETPLSKHLNLRKVAASIHFGE